ncbi:uncharacterized protein K444DRAFT_408292 [Hyaloscypha bicolor E]|uniref:Uncharacterized protein n=1 Tax=Hyaloscypha bicolor E TaxID=1095630 RepID=A0A2J6T9M5_9HELO|nr:uncharacterized protein K444DRAFT_408292 [Hyaloscypha bicolor E]PMD59709.1 hypothetical protein K444DRAFT_408292 [Hyaloscypha bicolor E]
MFTGTSSHFYLLSFLSILLLWAVQLILRPSTGHNKQNEVVQSGLQSYICARRLILTSIL